MQSAVEVDAETNRTRLNLLHILDGYRGRGFGTMPMAACMNHWKPLEHALGPVGDRMVVREWGRWLKQDHLIGQKFTYLDRKMSRACSPSPNPLK